MLEEGRITLSGYDVEIATNFIFIGTMNPEDFSGTEKLSEVLLDRFDMIFIDYPEDIKTEVKIVRDKGINLDVDFPDDLLKRTIGFLQWLRKRDELERVPSVRASLGLYERAQSNALLSGRKKVKIDDVLDAVMSVIAHRIRLKPSLRFDTTTREFVHNKFLDYTKRKSDKEGEVP